ncbi:MULTISPECIES: methylated-DNA--[protein]-cysteine S-methyltransferase [unclassified Brevibacterium]|uniref:methylated-DNA--[protein]-cysteine S-methyltransferase n=1 Tax=unclassified Brevibacterium TaxID=2614124 RepID=UPI0010926694|nr:methylated-DNA--[protein]-cysteine S-methyltransferase [Brevibacterium sp. S22]TGD31639.1 methylated-DNA--[protein]-cysteine S-methyltransferase [Brevibacterium sp. S22]
MMTSAAIDTPVGPLNVTSDGQAIVRLEWVSPAEAAIGSGPSLEIRQHRGEEAEPDDGDPILTEALAQLRAYFDGRLGDFDLPVDFGRISDVARTVLTALAGEVPTGTTITYGELADRSGTGVPARAIGGIMGLNPIPIIVACHRVVAGDGLGGYSGGLPGHELETKRRLLEWENALPQPLF